MSNSNGASMRERSIVTRRVSEGGVVIRLLPRLRVGLRWACAIAATCILPAGCERDMANQPKYEPYEASKFFDNGEASREPVPGTVARGHLQTDEHFFTGKTNGEFVESFPNPIDKQMLLRGQQRFNIFCSQCHGLAGYGDGMVVRRGFPQPPSYHEDRLREAPVGHLFDVITNGFGRMKPHGYMIAPSDRWAIVAYVRALQQSQHVTVESGILSADDETKLRTSTENGQP